MKKYTNSIYPRIPYLLKILDHYKVKDGKQNFNNIFFKFGPWRRYSRLGIFSITFLGELEGWKL